MAKRKRDKRASFADFKLPEPTAETEAFCTPPDDAPPLKGRRQYEITVWGQLRRGANRSVPRKRSGRA